jgi:hypothetical protein
MLAIATYLRFFSSHSVEEYWCYPNSGPCPSTHAPLAMIPVAGKLGSYSNVQHKKCDRYRVEIFAPSIHRIPCQQH